MPVSKEAEVNVRWIMALMWLPMAACSVSSGFSGPGYDGALTTDAEGPFVAVVTHTRPAKGERKAFGDHVDGIMDQLDTQPGYIGGALRARVMGSERWTLTVWEDEESMHAFVLEGAHRQALETSGTVIDGVRSAMWTLSSEEVPPSWDEALSHLDGVPEAF